MMNSRSLKELHPVVRMMAEDFVVACHEAGIEVIITSTYRDHASQEALYAQGRTTPGKVVTKARGGDSFHNWRVAFDFLVLRHGKPVWGTSGNGVDDNPADDEKDDLELWQRAGAIAEAQGLEWGGRWKFRDLPHCQFTGGLTIADFKSGKQLRIA